MTLDELRNRLVERGFKLLPENAVVFGPWVPGETHGNLEDVQTSFEELERGTFFVTYATSLYCLVDGDQELFLSEEELAEDRFFRFTKEQERAAEDEMWQYPDSHADCDCETKVVVLLPLG